MGRIILVGARGFIPYIPALHPLGQWRFAPLFKFAPGKFVNPIFGSISHHNPKIFWSLAFAKDQNILGLVGARGFEPPTARPPAECATRLRYAPLNLETSVGQAFWVNLSVLNKARNAAISKLFVSFATLLSALRFIQNACSVLHLFAELVKNEQV